MARYRQLVGAILAAFILALAGCGGDTRGGASGTPGGGSGGSLGTPGRSAAVALYGISASDLEIASALYRDAARVPAGFYVDPVPSGQGYVATRHIQSADVSATPVANFELCSDDWNQALQWSETAATVNGVYSNLVGNLSSSRYFEFDRVRPGTPVELVRQRVYRCSYLDRSAAVSGVGSGSAGTLNLRPLSTGDLRTLSEYLWRFTLWNNFGSAVLVSRSDPIDPAQTHTLVVANLVVAELANNGAAPGCDRIDVMAWQHTVDSSTGALQRRLVPLWNFTVRQVAASVAGTAGSTDVQPCGS